MIVKKYKIKAKNVKIENDVNTLVKYNSGKLDKSINVKILSTIDMTQTFLNTFKYPIDYSKPPRIFAPYDGWFIVANQRNSYSDYDSNDMCILVNGFGTHPHVGSFFNGTISFYVIAMKCNKGDLLTIASVFRSSSIPYFNTNNFCVIYSSRCGNMTPISVLGYHGYTRLPNIVDFLPATIDSNQNKNYKRTVEECLNISYYYPHWNYLTVNVDSSKYRMAGYDSGQRWNGNNWVYPGIQMLKHVGAI